jgi:hypothetical protein
MAEQDQHDLVEMLHTIDRAKRREPAEFDSTSIMRRLIIELLHKVDRLEHRIIELEK